MILFYLETLGVFLVLLLLWFESPFLTLGLLILEVLVAVLLLAYLKSVWFAITLLLVFLGGLLVLFAYASSLVGFTETPRDSSLWLKLGFCLGLSSLGLICLTTYPSPPYEMARTEFSSPSQLMSFLSAKNYSLVVLFLLLTLLTVCWILKIKKGPLR